ncbi:hypothetical protein D3C71_2149740 [compost metagenome]
MQMFEPLVIAEQPGTGARLCGEAGQQEGKAFHEAISLPRIFNIWRVPSSRAPEPSSSQDLVIRVSPRS